MLNSPGTPRQSALHHGPITVVEALREAQLNAKPPAAHGVTRVFVHVREDVLTRLGGEGLGKWKCLVQEEMRCPNR